MSGILRFSAAGSQRVSGRNSGLWRRISLAKKIAPHLPFYCGFRCCMCDSKTQTSKQGGTLLDHTKRVVECLGMSLVCSSMIPKIHWAPWIRLDYTYTSFEFLPGSGMLSLV